MLPVKLTSLFIFFRYVFNRLSVENYLFLVAVVTDKEAKIIKNMYIEK